MHVFIIVHKNTSLLVLGSMQRIPGNKNHVILHNIAWVI